MELDVLHSADNNWLVLRAEPGVGCPVGVSITLPVSASILHSGGDF